MSTQQAQVFQTPDEIAYYRFTALKFALKREMICKQYGMTVPRAIRPQLAKEFCLGPRAPYTTYIAYCETQQAVLLAKRTFATTRPTKDVL